GGFAICGHCGKPLGVKRMGTVRAFSYTCSDRNASRYGCPKASIRCEILDRAIWNYVEHRLPRADLIEEQLQRLRDNDPTEHDLAGVDRQLADTERHLANLHRSLARFDDDEQAAPTIAN